MTFPYLSERFLIGFGNVFTRLGSIVGAFWNQRVTKMLLPIHVKSHIEKISPKGVIRGVGFFKCCTRGAQGGVRGAFRTEYSGGLWRGALTRLDPRGVGLRPSAFGFWLSAISFRLSTFGCWLSSFPKGTLCKWYPSIFGHASKNNIFWITLASIK
jgi:hypothetical protein